MHPIDPDDKYNFKPFPDNFIYYDAIMYDDENFKCISIY